VIIGMITCAMFLPPPVFARWLIVRRPNWTGRRIVFVSAGIIPAVLMIPIIVFLGATIWAVVQDQCSLYLYGCSFPGILGGAFAGADVLIFIVSLLLSGLVVFISYRNLPDQRDETSQ